ncbi:cytochrome P450 [Coniochaeta sp. 2T2.1]|nr:cytochrome P450 [Coniochaeta sp. 2T2.1]
MGPGEVSFISGGPLMEKSPIFLGAVENSFSIDWCRGVSLALNADHARQRSALGYLFTNSALLQFERLRIQKFIAVLEDAASQSRPINVSSWYTYLAFDIMGDICFAEPFGCLAQASATDWSTSVINVFVAATWTQGIRRLSGVGTLLESLLTWLFVPASAADWRKTHLDHSRDKTLRRLRDPDQDHKDFLYHILANNESKKVLSQTEIILNVALFISAGTDTTATTLTGWTYFVCTHPEVYRRLVSETLRLYPPSPASQQRIVPQVVPRRWYHRCCAAVGGNPFGSELQGAQRPQPERWLGEDARYYSDSLNASLPFCTGPRVCIGRNLAYMEMRLICAHLIRCFDIQLDRAAYKRKNNVRGLDGEMKPMKVFHSMTKPELWVCLK